MTYIEPEQGHVQAPPQPHKRIGLRCDVLKVVCHFPVEGLGTAVCVEIATSACEGIVPFLGFTKGSVLALKCKDI